MAGYEDARCTRAETRGQAERAGHTYLRNAWFYIGDCAFDLGDYDAAVNSYDAARQRYANDLASLVAMVQIVNAYVAQDRWAEARTANEACRAAPGQVPRRLEPARPPMDAGTGSGGWKPARCSIERPAAEERRAVRRERTEGDREPVRTIPSDGGDTNARQMAGKNRTTTGPRRRTVRPVSVPVDAAAGSAGASSVDAQSGPALEEQRALCEKLDQLSLAPARSHRGGVPTRLVELLTCSRQVVIDRLDALSRPYVEPLREGRRALCLRSPPPIGPRVDELLEFVAASTERVRSRDDQDRARSWTPACRRHTRTGRDGPVPRRDGGLRHGPPAAPTYHDRRG